MAEEKDHGPHTKDDRVDNWAVGGALHTGAERSGMRQHGSGRRRPATFRSRTKRGSGARSGDEEQD